MPSNTSKLTWCKARLGQDMNWWVEEISDPVRWDVDGLGVIDPRQMQHILDLLEPLNDYGLRTGIVDDAFYSFAIENVNEDKSVQLRRVGDSILESEEQLFALPDILDEEKGPYADLLDHVTKLRVKMLNELIDFSQNLTVEELEEEIRESQNKDFLEGRATHFFNELTAVLEYVPEGFELEEEEVDGSKSDDEKLEKDLADVEDAPDEDTIETDETMRWDDDEDGEEFDDNPEVTSPPAEPESGEEKKK